MYKDAIWIILFLLFPTSSMAQTIEINDSLKTELNNHENSYIKTYEVDSLQVNENILNQQDVIKFVDKINFKNNLFQNYNTPISPFVLYSYISKNSVEGLTMKGISHTLNLANYLSADIDFYISEYYNGLFMPSSYLNGSVRLGITLKLHDRVQLVGMGQLSLREGIDPKVPSTLGASNYYGTGIQIKVTNKIGFGVGVTNNYYRGSWSKQTYFTPVGY